MSGYELVRVQSGVASLRCLETGEVFHPVIGPMREARELHVAQQNLRERAATMGGMILWDVGLGAAANAIAAIEALRDIDAGIAIHSFDRTTAPLEFAIGHAAALEYPRPHADTLRDLLENGETVVGGTSSIRWTLHLGDFTRKVRDGNLPEPPDAIFYDPYSPTRNTAMWTVEHLSRLRAFLTRPCTGTTYTRSTAMRVAFLMAGYLVGRGLGIGEKDETTLVATDLELLANPLRIEWLDRVGRSSSATPLSEIGPLGMSPAAIGPQTMAALRAHPQFRGE